MSMFQKQPDDLSESVHDEGRAERLGHQLGFAIGHMRQQIQHRVTNPRLGKEHAVQEEREPHTHEPGAGGEESAARMHRAEDIVDDAGHRLSDAASRTGIRLQKVTTRMREEAEDILAEAQHLRHPTANKPTPGNHAPSRAHDRSHMTR